MKTAVRQKCFLEVALELVDIILAHPQSVSVNNNLFHYNWVLTAFFIRRRGGGGGVVSYILFHGTVMRKFLSNVQ